MSSAVCPYCRGAIDAQAGEELVCPGCGTPHHADCYAENGGCTVFGCSAAPPEEPKVRLTGSEIANPVPVAANAGGSSGDAPGQVGPTTPAARVKAPPPPLLGSPTQSPAVRLPRFGASSVLFGVQPVAAVATASPSAELTFEDVPEAKNRMTFIVLGVLLGFLGAHNFYAGYRGKAIGQLCITVLSLGFASPMSWVWAVIDVLTVDRDSKGIKFRS